MAVRQLRAWCASPRRRRPELRLRSTGRRARDPMRLCARR